MSVTPHLGIDVAVAEDTCRSLLCRPCRHLREDATEASRRFVVSNSLTGAERLAAEVLDLMHRYHLARLVIGLEATDLYWGHLGCLLNCSPQLSPFQPKVYAFNTPA